VALSRVISVMFRNNGARFQFSPSPPLFDNPLQRTPLKFRNIIW